MIISPLVSDLAREYDSEPKCLRDARKIIVKHAFFLEVFASNRIPMDKKVQFYGERLSRVLREFGLDD